VADEVYEFNLTIPAHTPIATPVVLPCKFAARKVESFTWRVPAGHGGVTGFRLSMGGVQVFPRNAGSWIIANGEAATWPVANVPDSGAWDITAYNTGNQPHLVFVRFMVALIRRAEPLPVQLPPWMLSSVPDLSQAGPPVARRP
jgi:hypothetical protein